MAASRHSTAVLAAYFAQNARSAGDCFLLYGHVGAGKSHFSREYIRFALGQEDMDVPSPTYLLHATYSQPGDDCVDIHHYDLYRLQQDGRDFTRLDLKHSLETGVCLVEWPERLAGMIPEERLELHLRCASGPENGDINEQSSDIEGDSGRYIRIRWVGQRWGRLVLALADHVKTRGSSLGLEVCAP